VTASLLDLTRARVAREHRADILAGALTKCECKRCGQPWTTNAGPRDNFSLVTKFCPDCVATLPRWGMA
jgi:hypothetical protein